MYIYDFGKHSKHQKDNKLQFGMVVDKLERRDYQVDDLEARVTYWNYFYANASCWGYEKDSVMW